MYLTSAIIKGEPLDSAISQAQSAEEKRQETGCHTDFPGFLLALASPTPEIHGTEMDIKTSSLGSSLGIKTVDVTSEALEN